MRGDGFLFFIIGVVSLDDAPHQGMAHHVGVMEVMEGDPAHSVQHAQRVDQAGAGFSLPLALAQLAALDRRQVDLSDVAGDHRPRAEAQTGEKHFHLFAGGVLGFVQDEKGVVESAAAHKGQGSHLDDAALLLGRQVGRAQHVPQGVVQGAQVGVDLFLHVAGQKTQLFPGFHGGSGEHDALDPLGRQHGQGHSHGQVSFAGARRSHGEHHFVAAQQVHVGPLRSVAGQNGLARGHDDAGLAEHVAEIGQAVAEQQFIALKQVLSAQGVTRFEQTVTLREQIEQKLPRFGPGVAHRQFGAPRGQLGAGNVGHQLEMGVERSEQSACQVRIVKGQGFRNGRRLHVCIVSLRPPRAVRPGRKRRGGTECRIKTWSGREKASAFSVLNAKSGQRPPAFPLSRGGRPKRAADKRGASEGKEGVAVIGVFYWRHVFCLKIC